MIKDTRHRLLLQSLLDVILDYLYLLVVDGHTEHLLEWNSQLDSTMSSLKFATEKRDWCTFHYSVEPLGENVLFSIVLTQKLDFILIKVFASPEASIFVPGLQALFGSIHLWSEQEVLA